MKKKNIDVLHDRVCALCVHLRDDTRILEKHEPLSKALKDTYPDNVPPAPLEVLR